MKWDAEAEKAVARVPFFVRGRVKKKVEALASERGARTVTVEHVEEAQRRYLAQTEKELRGFQVEGCFAAAGCPNATLEPGDLPERLEALLAARELREFLLKRVGGPLKPHHQFRVVFAQCPNACSRPQIADLALIGACRPVMSADACTGCGDCATACKEDAIWMDADGVACIDRERCLVCGECIAACPSAAIERGETGYRVLIGGKLGRHPRLARELPGIHSPDAVLDIVAACLDHFMEHNRRGERFGEIIERTGFFDTLARRLI